MRQMLIAVVILAFSQVSAEAQTAPAGDPDKGRGMFSGQAGSGYCMFCHGRQGEGGFGPDLAGRGLTFEQFKRAVQNPWGVMPRYSTITEQGLADLYAFVKSLPPAPKVGEWTVPTPPANAPLGQALMIASGCGQCHGPEIGHPRRDLGAKGAVVSFEDFAKIVYEAAPVQMGQFNRHRVSEPVLREIWKFTSDMGLRSFLWAQMTAGAVADGNTTYTITLRNRGQVGKGLSADDITVSLVVPQGLRVLSGTGGSFGGVKNGVDYITNPQQLTPFRSFNPNPMINRVKGDVATWKVNKVAPGDSVTLTVTMAGVGTTVPNFTGSTITWGTPEVKRLPNIALRDERLADRGDILYAPSPEFTLPPQKP